MTAEEIDAMLDEIDARYAALSPSERERLAIDVEFSMIVGMVQRDCHEKG